MKCVLTCVTEKCHTFGNCDAIDYQFEIVVPEDPDARKIRSGAKVALRSRSNQTQWLDCSNSDGECSVLRCTKDATNACYSNPITSCDSHHFKIYGVGRREGRLLNSSYRVYFRHSENDSILSCYSDKCKLSSNEDFYSGENDTQESQIFSFTIIH